MQTILFQGDSITDVGRNRENDNARGHGYATMTAARLMLDHPGQFQIINRGIGGNRIVDLYARIKMDFINLKPDYLSILVGVNDVWHEVARENGVDNEKFLRVYCWLIEEIKAALPDIKIYILEPFVLKGPATEEHFDLFDREVRLRAESAKKVAEKYNLTFIPLQDKLDALCEVCESTYWLGDGVHPTAAGHELIARALTEAIQRDI